MSTTIKEALSRHGKKVAKRFGAGAFLFFAIKGLLWLLIPAVAAALATK
jgi:hypothetical protein